MELALLKMPVILQMKIEKRTYWLKKKRNKKRLERKLSSRLKEQRNRLLRMLPLTKDSYHQPQEL
jgi:hypothetical protein